MIDFVLHTAQTAPAESGPVLAAVEKQLGFVPNLLRMLAESPAAAQAYATVSQLLDASSLTAAERHVVLQTVNLIHECHYCLPAHTAMAGMSGLGALDRALRGGAPLGDAKLEALRQFTRLIVTQRGRVTPDAMAAFHAAGYEARQVLEVIVGVALKTISNYANHVARTPVDAVFGGKTPVIPVEELVRRAVGGDKKALEAAIAAVSPLVYRLALRILGDPVDAEDAAQEVLVRVVTSLGSYRGEAAFTTWVYRVATNHLLNVKRGRAEEQASFERLAEQIDAGAAEDGESSHDRLLKREVVLGCTQAMLMCLDREHRMALVLGDVFDLSHEEAAFVLDVQPAAYRKRLERARERVTAFLRRRCGVFDAAAACRCAKQVTYATRIGVLRPGHLRFAMLPAEGGTRDFEELVDVANVARMYRSQPMPRPPDALLHELRRLMARPQ